MKMKLQCATWQACKCICIEYQILNSNSLGCNSPSCLSCIRCLPKFIVSTRGPYGSTNPESGKAYFDHEALHKATKIVTRNLNKIIDVNKYPIPEAKVSNNRHRPVGIGVSGLADAFLRLGLPFTSDNAKQLNEAIFETIYHASLEASAEIAETEGPYETFEGSPASQGKLQFNLWGMKDDETPSQRGCEDIDGNIAKQKYSDKVQVNGYDWEALRTRIKSGGIRNSLLVAPMPTASTSQVLGVNECFEPFVSNMYLRRVKAGEVSKKFLMCADVFYFHSSKQNCSPNPTVYHGKSSFNARPN
jgi:ribonucleotide reductase alpha subunit